MEEPWTDSGGPSGGKSDKMPESEFVLGAGFLAELLQ